MKEFADFLRAVATLLWPIFAFSTLFIFKKEISEIIARLRRGKVLGQEFELSESLEKLDRSAVAAANEVASFPAPGTSASPEEPGTDDEVRTILHEAARSPRAALMLLASDLEREARQLLASGGHHRGQRHVPLSQALKILSGGLPGHIPSSLKQFWEVRNRLIHGRDAEPEDILRAIDSGITILKALRAYPQEVNVVYHPGVELFQDPACRKGLPDAKGVILETESPEGTSRVFRIFPTTRTHFQNGKRVAWEWNNELLWGPAWYKDPDTGEVKPAWSSSMEFIGRHLDEV